MLDTMVQPDNIRGLYRSEYEKLIDLGVFDGQRVELLHGQVVEMSPQGDAHVTIVRRLAAMLTRQLPTTLEVSSHSGVPAGDKSRPEPDISIFPYRPGRHQAENVLLVIEVSDSSLRNDRFVKPEIYAGISIPEYWVVDVRHELVIVHTLPTTGGYQRVEQYARGAELRPVSLPNFTITVDAILDA
jgi:Uma2 family endonuclease